MYRVSIYDHKPLHLEVTEPRERNNRLRLREEKFEVEDKENKQLQPAVLKAADADEKKALEREVNRLSALSGERFCKQEELQRDVNRLRKERDALLSNKGGWKQEELQREVDRLRKELKQKERAEFARQVAGVGVEVAKALFGP